MGCVVGQGDSTMHEKSKEAPSKAPTAAHWLGGAASFIKCTNFNLNLKHHHKAPIATSTQTEVDKQAN